MHCLQGDVALDRHRAVPGGGTSGEWKLLFGEWAELGKTRSPSRCSRARTVVAWSCESPASRRRERRAERTRRRTRDIGTVVRRGIMIATCFATSTSRRSSRSCSGVFIMLVAWALNLMGFIRGSRTRPRRGDVTYALLMFQGPCSPWSGSSPELPRAHGEPRLARRYLAAFLLIGTAASTSWRSHTSRIRVRRRILRGSRAVQILAGITFPYQQPRFRRRLALFRSSSSVRTSHTDVAHLAHRRSGGHRSSRRHFEVDRSPHRRGLISLMRSESTQRFEAPPRVAHQDDLTDRMTPGRRAADQQPRSLDADPGRTVSSRSARDRLPPCPSDGAETDRCSNSSRLGETDRDLADFSRDKQVALLRRDEEPPSRTIWNP